MATRSPWGRLRRFLGWTLPSCAVIPAVLLLAGLVARGESIKGAASELPTLTTARQAHRLSSEEARRAYPIHLRGVVTYFDADTGTGFGAIYIHDSSGSIFVKNAGGAIKELPVGSLVDVRGVSDPGGFAPIVARPLIRVIRQVSLPGDAAPVSRTQLFAGEYEGQWVEVEGIIHSVSGSGHTVVLKLGMSDGTLFATTVRAPDVNYSALVDAKVRIRGNEAPLFNGSGQMTGARVVFSGLSLVKVMDPAPSDPFQLPTVPIDGLLRWNQMSAIRHRVHLRGRVTMLWPGASLCIRDSTRGICAQTAQDTHLDPGDMVDVVGFAGAEESTSALTDAVYRSVAAEAPVSAQPVTAVQALTGKQDSELIQVDGMLIGRDLASSDAKLMLTSGDLIFTAVLPQSLAGPDSGSWKNGSRLRVTGICSVQFDAQTSVLKDGMAMPKSFRVLMRSPGDVVVMQRPSWWTAAHALWLMTIVLIGTLVVLGWVVVLRKRIRESEEQFRHMAHHDSLTGLNTRRVLVDRLKVAFEIARRHQKGLAVLMVDLDNFKDINDQFGHHTGDEVLRATANRLLAAVRKSDTVARIGGDEFVVLLPESGKGNVAESIADKLVAALAEPIFFEGQLLPVSASIGISTLSAPMQDADELLKSADTALYFAKEHGRNRFETFAPGSATASEIARP